MFKNFTSAVLLAVGAIGQMVYPGDTCCTFYEEENFTGTKHSLCHAGSLVNYNVKSLGWGDNIASYECGAFTKVDMC